MMHDKNDFPGLPKAWVWTKLREIQLDISHSITPNKTPEQMFELYSVPNFKTGKPEIISGKEIGSSKRTVFEDTVLLCKINPRINRIWIVGNHSTFPKISSTEWIPFFPLEGIEPKYLCYFMQNSNFRDFLSTNASGVGGSLMRIKPTTFSQYFFPFAPLPEQHRIVTKVEELFTKLDAGIGALKKIKKQLKCYRRSVLKSAFEGKLTEEWREKQKDELEPASLLLERIKEERKKYENDKKRKNKELLSLITSNLPELPEGWESVQLKEIGEIITGTTPSKKKKEYYKNDFCFYKPTDLNVGFYVKKSQDRLSKLGIEKARLLPVKSILVTCIGATIGKTGFIRTEGASNQQINAIVPFKEFLPEWIYFMVISPQFQKSIIKNSSSTTLPIINKSKFENLAFPLASFKEQQKIVEEVKHHFSIANEIEKVVDQNLQLSKQLRQSILKKAFEGKLVPQNPTDEPAEKLLERITCLRAKMHKQKAEKEKNSQKNFFKRRRKFPSPRRRRVRDEVKNKTRLL